jgi:hypothetical protein
VEYDGEEIRTALAFRGSGFSLISNSNPMFPRSRASQPHPSAVLWWVSKRLGTAASKRVEYCTACRTEFVGGDARRPELPRCGGSLETRGRNFRCMEHLGRSRLLNPASEEGMNELA